MLWGSQSKGILKMLTVIKEHLGYLSSVQLKLLEFCFCSKFYLEVEYKDNVCVCMCVYIIN